MRWSSALSSIKHKGSEHFYFVGATVVSAGVKFAYTIVARAYVDPAEYGIYSACLLLQTFMTYLQLGSLNAFNRDYPQYVGRGDWRDARSARESVFSFLAVVFSLATSALTIILFVGNNTGVIEGRYAFGLMLCAATTSLTVIENFACSRVRIDGDFKFASFVMVAELAAVVLGVAGVVLVGYYGLYLSNIGAMLIGIVLYYKKGLSDIRFCIDKKMLIAMLISGIPLLINGLIWTAVNSIDKFVILGFMDSEALGLYSIAQMAFSYMILIPTAMSQLFYVKLGKLYGATGDRSLLHRTAEGQTTILALISSVAAIAAFYFMEPLVNLLLPNYSEGVGAARILLIGLAVYAPTMIGGNILTILKKNAALLNGSILLCVLNVLCSVGLVVLLGPTIGHVALGTVLSYFMRTLVVMGQLKHHAGSNIKNLAVSILVPVFIVIVPGIAMYYAFDGNAVGLLFSLVFSGCVSTLLYKERISSVLRAKD